MQSETTEQFEPLYRLLETELAQSQLAVDALQRKKMALVASKPQTLLQVDRELQAIARKTRQLEKERQHLMAELGYPKARLETVIETMPSQLGKRFRILREQLLRSIQDAGQLNRESQNLLNLSLAWIQETVEIIANAITPECVSYNAQGGKGKKGNLLAPPVQSTINHSA